MRVSSFRGMLCGALAVALACGAGTIARAEDDDSPQHSTAPLHQGLDDDGETAEYWLGLNCTELGDDLRDELKLDESKGVVVMDIVPESPAAKAGLKKHDVLLAADDVDLRAPKDLVTAVRKTKDRELKLKFVRDGEKKEVTVKPEKRSGEGAGKVWMKGAPFNVRIYRPGRVLPPHVAIHLHRHELPDDMTVTIKKHGKEPAQITISQGDKTWEASEEKLDELPEEVRPHAEALLGRFAMPLPPGIDKVWTYLPDGKQFNSEVQEAKELAKRAAHEAQETAREAHRQAEKVQREAAEVAREAHREAIEKAREARRALAGSAREKVESAKEQGRAWVDRQLDEKFDELDRRLEELRGMVKALRESRKAQPEEKPGDAGKP